LRLRQAQLFDKQKELLVIPVSVTNYGVIGAEKGEDYASQGGLWQGAYVFNVTTRSFTHVLL
jgi:hypothetical protein